jgi:peptidoglycan/LPS O-acetylase OafA/YrhL
LPTDRCNGRKAWLTSMCRNPSWRRVGRRWPTAFWVFDNHKLAFGALLYPFDLPIRLGFLEVTFSLILSGFVPTRVARPSLPVSTFCVRRFGRVWPTHTVPLLMAVPVFYTLTAAPAPADSWVKTLSNPIVLLSVVLFQGFSRNLEILFSSNPAA